MQTSDLTLIRTIAGVVFQTFQTPKSPLDSDHTQDSRDLIKSLGTLSKSQIDERALDLLLSMEIIPTTEALDAFIEEVTRLSFLSFA